MSTLCRTTHRLELTALALVALALGLAASPALSRAQPGRTARGTPTPLSPCCSITGVDARTGLVTAKLLATGVTFQFRFGKVGTSPVDGATAGNFQPVENLQGFDPAKVGRPLPIGPVDAVREVSALKIGQLVWADGAGRVGLKPGVPCCSVVSP